VQAAGGELGQCKEREVGKDSARSGSR